VDSEVGLRDRRLEPEMRGRLEEADGEEMHALVSAEGVSREILLERLENSVSGWGGNVKMLQPDGFKEDRAEEDESEGIALIELVKEIFLSGGFVRAGLGSWDPDEAGWDGADQSDDGPGRPGRVGLVGNDGRLVLLGDQTGSEVVICVDLHWLTLSRLDIPARLDDRLISSPYETFERDSEQSEEGIEGILKL
jgi:hypothetical protein